MRDLLRLLFYPAVYFGLLRTTGVVRGLAATAYFLALFGMFTLVMAAMAWLAWLFHRPLASPESRAGKDKRAG